MLRGKMDAFDPDARTVQEYRRRHGQTGAPISMPARPAARC
jgi:hypothetical protein